MGVESSSGKCAIGKRGNGKVGEKNVARANAVRDLKFVTLLHPVYLQKWKRQKWTFNFDHGIVNIMLTAVFLLKCFMFNY